MERIEFEDALVVEPAKVSVLDEMPVGTVVDFDGTEVPAGWEEIDEFIPELIKNALYYKNDDVYYASNVFIGGYLTTGGTKIRTTIFTNKSLEKIKSITINSFELYVRKDNGGYLTQSSKQDFDNNGWTYTATKKGDNVITFEFTGTYEDTLNNSPLGIELDELSLTFNE